ncbi:NADP-dependent oxidoreductase [uncultured Massilia sp.]|uniref:NADP-dependent oxidoreductase n=1 Tax=uncultured Massilia sp. TaxID=169973 RepID=UPI00258D626C|nr:NADP-dependent oxidoreductase [uncultured Massilia sp.]
MQAVSINQYGDNGVLHIGAVDRPTPEAGQILVKVHAAGVNPVDWKIRGGAGQRMGLTLPLILGGEISGVVAAVGEGVDRCAVGDAVYGIVKSGGFAEYVAVDAADMAPKPASLCFIDAAAIPLGALTAWQAMFGLAQLAAGQRLLITNGAGGVGSLAIQIANAAGAHVTAMASGRNEAFVRGLGADAFIDYTAGPFEAQARDMDVVFDTVGGDTYRRAFASLKPGGFLVTAVAFPLEEDGRQGVGVARVSCKPDAEQLAAIGALVEAGKLTPQVTTVLPLAQAGEALALSEAGRTRGKIVLRIAESQD